MPPTTQSYGIEKLRWCRLDDVLRWIRSNALNDPYDVGELSKNLARHFTNLIIQPHHFAASVVSRVVESCFNIIEGEYIQGIDYNQQSQCIVVRTLIYGVSNGLYDNKLPINPFEGMTNADGTPRTSCTREELEQWLKEMEG